MPQIVFVDPEGREVPREGGQQTIRQFSSCPPTMVGVRLSGFPKDASVEVAGSTPATLEQVEVEDDQTGTWRRSDRVVKDTRAEAATAAGDVVVRVLRGGVVLAAESLRVRPANFDDAEYQRMLLEIGLLAASSASWVQGDVRADAVTGVGDDLGHRSRSREVADHGLVQAVMTARVLLDSLPAMERSPLRALRSEVRPSDVARAVARVDGLRRHLTTPGKSKVVVARPAESLDTEEHRWLRWLVDGALIPRLEAHVHLAGSAWGSEGDDGEDWFRSAVKDALARGGNANPHLRLLLESPTRVERPSTDPSGPPAEAVLRELRLARRSSPVLTGEAPATMPRMSERLLGHPAYRAVAEQWIAATGLNTTSATRGLRFLRAVLRREVRATWKCFEAWCFVRLAAALHHVAGFSTTRGRPTLAEIVEIHRGELRLRKGLDGALLMVRREGSGEELKVRIAHEPVVQSTRDGEGRERPPGAPLSKLTPDILVSFFGAGGRELAHVVFDAKYASYTAEPGRAWADLWTTARVKYLEGLRGAHELGAPDAIWPVASFILHSDNSFQGSRWNPQFEYWGEQPVRMRFRPPGEPHPGEDLPDVTGHRVGLVRLRPGPQSTRQFAKLVDLMLLYHLQNIDSNWQFVCPRCGARLTPGQDVRPASLRDWAERSPGEEGEVQRVARGRGSGSLYCRCPDCGFGWLRNNCVRDGDEPRHLLIKRGPVMGWHMPTRHRDKIEGMYVCPVCGSDPDPDFWRHRPLRRLEQRDFAWPQPGRLRPAQQERDDDDGPF